MTNVEMIAAVRKSNLPAKVQTEIYYKLTEADEMKQKLSMLIKSLKKEQQRWNQQ